MIKLKTPLLESKIKKLKVGDEVLLSGVIYTARDSAHKRFLETLKREGKLPLDLSHQVVYYMGPTPARPGAVIGSAGPTTASRMDGVTLPLLKKGLKGMIGKGPRSKEVNRVLKDNKAVYFVAVGGAGALLSERIKESQVVLYPDLGAEAVRRLLVKDFPLLVANDIYGGNIFEN